MAKRTDEFFLDGDGLSERKFVKKVDAALEVFVCESSGQETVEPSFGVEDYPGTGSLKPLTVPVLTSTVCSRWCSDPRYMGDVGKVRPYKDLRLAYARQKFGEFFDGIDPEDVVLIYFSGHGLRDVDAVGHLYLCFTDTDENKLDLTAQRATEIGEWLDRRGFRRTLRRARLLLQRRGGE